MTEKLYSIVKYKVPILANTILNNPYNKENDRDDLNIMIII